jgi:predicted P-loop ATPase
VYDDDLPPTGISRAAWVEMKRRYGAEKAEAMRNSRKKKAAEAHEADGFVHGDAGQILKGHPGNIRHAVQQLGVVLRLNQFSVQTEVACLDGHGQELNDAGAVRLRLLIHETYGFLPTQELFEQVLVDIAHQNRFHPVRDYLDGLKWDGTPRLVSWLSYYLGADESEYVETVGKAFFIAMVARIYSPGCKQDYMLIIEGPQGVLKSMACEAIAGNWFSDNLPDVRDSKDLSQHLQGKWLIEIGELSALSKAETTTLKAFITRRTERYRPSYGRREVIQPRQCVFIGTTNAECYLKDATGGRRFWPVKAGSIDLDALRTDRDQLFAEAVHLFKEGAHWWPDKDFEAKHIKPEQDARYLADPWQEIIAAYIETRERVTIGMIAKDALFIETPRLATRDSHRIIDVLTALGWMQKRSHGVGWYVPRVETRLF